MSKFCLSVFSLATLSLFVPKLSSQDPGATAVTPQNNSGDLPYSTSIGSATEHIDLASGNLIVTIPFVNVPGRHLDFDYGIRYDARFWITQHLTNTYNFEPDYNAWLTPNVIGWTGTQGSVVFTRGSTYCHAGDGSQQAGGGQKSPGTAKNGGRVDNFVYTDRRGVKHSALVNVYSSGECLRSSPESSEGYVSSNLEGPSPDMDGYYATGDFSGTFMLYAPDGSVPVNYQTSGSPSASGGLGDPDRGVIFRDAFGENDPSGNAQTVAPGGDDSIGRTPITSNINGSTITYTYTDSNGQQQSYVVSLEDIAIQTGFSAVTNAGAPYNDFSGTKQVVSSVLLPDGTSYSFTYDSYGEITSITMPTGAVMRYQWDFVYFPNALLRGVTQRTIQHDSTVDTWDLSYNNSSVTVTQPADAQGVRHVTFYQYDGFQHLQTVRYQQTTDPSSTLIQYDMTWDTSRSGSSTGAEDSLLTSLKTTLENNLVSERDFEYDLYAYPHQVLDCGQDYQTCDNEAATGQWGPPTYLQPPAMMPGSHGNVATIREYDWGSGAPGPLIRQTIRTYLQDQNPEYFAVPNSFSLGVHGSTIRNIVNRVVDEAVYDGSVICTGAGTWNADTEAVTPPSPCQGNKVSETRVTYDYGDPVDNGYRGLPTKVERWAGGAIYIPTTYTYDQYGNVTSTTDPNGHNTQYGYADAWATGNSACTVPGQSNAYLTSITNALQQTTSSTYFLCSGLAGIENRC